MRKIFREI